MRRETDKLAAIRDVNNLFVSNCRKCYRPGIHVTIDEQLMGFRGRVPFRVYMGNKPDKYGIKIWMMCDVETHYALNFQVYTGKEGETAERNQGKRVFWIYLKVYLLVVV